MSDVPTIFSIPLWKVVCRYRKEYIFIVIRLIYHLLKNNIKMYNHNMAMHIFTPCYIQIYNY